MDMYISYIYIYILSLIPSWRILMGQMFNMIFATVTGLFSLIFKLTKAANNLSDIALDASANHKSISKIENKRKLDKAKARLKLTAAESDQVDAEIEQQKEDDESRLP